MFYGAWRIFFAVALRYSELALDLFVLLLPRQCVCTEHCSACRGLRMPGVWFPCSTFFSFSLCFFASFQIRPLGAECEKKIYMWNGQVCVTVVHALDSRHEIHMVCLPVSPVLSMQSSLPILILFGTDFRALCLLFSRSHSICRLQRGYELWHLRSTVFASCCFVLCSTLGVTHDRAPSLEYKKNKNEKFKRPYDMPAFFVALPVHSFLAFNFSEHIDKARSKIESKCNQQRIQSAATVLVPTTFVSAICVATFAEEMLNFHLN